MKRFLLMMVVLFSGVLSAQAQTASDLNEGQKVVRSSTTGVFTLSWWGKAGRTYFIQQSFDLINWQYVPSIESGADAVCGLNFSCSDPRQFWRLKYTDVYTENAATDDFDYDGLTNQQELNLGLDPFAYDTDGDGLGDSWEVAHGLDPKSAAGVNGALGDPDGDLLSNQDEQSNATDPHDADSDDDTLNDYAEAMTYLTNPNVADSEGDGLGDAAEVLVYLTDPWDWDTDGDSLSDVAEINTYLTNPLNKDSDSDGLNDAAEVNTYQTNPNVADSDGDGITDKSEVMQGTNANSASSRPAFESVEIVGDGAQGVRKSKQMTITLPQGARSYLVLIAVQSAEFPNWTVLQSPFDDVVDWKITPAGGTVLQGEKHVNELHADWEQSQADGTSYLGLSPVALVKVETIQGSATGTTSVQIEVGAKNVSDDALPTTVAVQVVPISIEPDANMAGVLGDVVKSVNPNSAVKHFVTPKKSTELAQDYVELKAVGVTAAQITDGNANQIVQWEGGEAVPNEPLKRRVKRDAATPTTVKIKAKQGGAVGAQMVVWVVWCDPPTVTNGAASFDQVTEQQTVNGIPILNVNVGASWHYTAFRKFKFVIKPVSMCDPNNQERPNLSGAKVNDPPGASKDYSFNPNIKADSATNKWDVSRQIKVTLRNPNSIPKASLEQLYPTAFCVNQPKANDSVIAFPGNPAEGNDDPILSPVDEDTDPYQAVASGDLQHGIGELTSIDAPSLAVKKSWGAAAYHFGAEYNFREFCRLEITNSSRSTGTFWFRISDYSDWHFYLSTDFDDTPHEWRDAAAPSQSRTNTGHPIP